MRLELELELERIVFHKKKAFRTVWLGKPSQVTVDESFAFGSHASITAFHLTFAFTGVFRKAVSGSIIPQPQIGFGTAPITPPDFAAEIPELPQSTDELETLMSEPVVVSAITWIIRHTLFFPGAFDFSSHRVNMDIRFFTIGGNNFEFVQRLAALALEFGFNNSTWHLRQSRPFGIIY